MHHCWFRHEGFPGRVDIADQVHRPAVGHHIGTVRGQRRPQRTFCGLHGKRHFALFQQIQAECLEDPGGLDGDGSCWGSGGFWQSHRWCFVLLRGKKPQNTSGGKELFTKHLQEMASYFPLKTLWRSYFCALVATSVLAVCLTNPFRQTSS